MLRHYIKMAMRHLLKNKIQNLISIVGLSVGILCFSICLYCSRFISEVDSCFSNKELIADINLCTTRGDLYSGIPATTIEELRKLRFDEVQDFTFTVYPRERSYNVEIKEGKELPYDHLMTMEVDSLFRKVFTPRILLLAGMIHNKVHNNTHPLSARYILARLLTHQKRPFHHTHTSSHCQRFDPRPSTIGQKQVQSHSLDSPRTIYILLYIP